MTVAEEPSGAMWFWSKFKGSGLWQLLKRVSFLRSCLYFAIELRRSWSESRASGFEAVESDFKRQDPWNYETNVIEQERFAKQTTHLDAAREERTFSEGLEIGCAEGIYTEIIAERCKSLQVLDFSPTALERTQKRRQWPDSVHFTAFDLKNEEIPATYDLVVITGVLEYFSKRTTFRNIRRKLCEALRPGGILLLETTRVNKFEESQWWCRFLIRGRWINEFIGREPNLSVISSELTDTYAITLFRKSAARRTD